MRSSASFSTTTALTTPPSLTDPPQDDRHIVNRWSALAADHKVDLVVCVAAALRRGIRDENLAPGFRISGLGQLVDSGIKADRLITFGD
jgi:tRNA 2-thiouridine synthesizing protein D